MGTLWLIVLFEFCLFFTLAQSEKKVLEARDYLANLKSAGYDPITRPTLINNLTAHTDVTVSMHVARFTDLDLSKNEIGIVFYLREKWMDHRLSYFSEASAHVPPNIIFNTYSDRSFIWLPDTYIVNEVSTKRTQSKQGSITISADGKVVYNRLIATTVYLDKSIEKFPSAKTNVDLWFESYSHTSGDIDYKWEHDGVGVGSSVELAGNRLESMRHDTTHARTKSGVYSRLRAVFVFARTTSRECYALFVPTTLIVIFSWIAFWIHSDHLAAKAIIGSTSLILLFLQIMYAYKDIPSTTYIKTIDYWTVFCFFLVFLSLLEFAVVAYLAKRRKATVIYTNNAATTNELHILTEKKPKKEGSDWDVKHLFKADRPLAIDVISRIAFPILFILLVIVYLIIA